MFNFKIDYCPNNNSRIIIPSAYTSAALGLYEVLFIL